MLVTAGGCGGGNGAGGAGTASAGKNPDGTADPDLKNPVVILRGGSAMSSGGQAQPGGTAHLVSAGGITIAADLSGPSVPSIPSPAADAMAVAAGSLGADLTAPGAVSLSGNMTVQGGDTVRQIVAGGDIFVGGTLRSADLGGARQGLTLRAMNGTVYVAGSVDTSGSANADQVGGALTIVARRVVVSGKLTTAGGSGSTGGDGGAVTIMATDGVFLTGTFDSSGGSGKDGSSSGGQGGALTIQAGGDVVLGGNGSVRGGAGGAQAGGAGAIAIDTAGTVAFTGTFDGRGGTASGGNGGRGGAAAMLKIGEATPPISIGFSVPLVLTGGDGAGVGGDGGAANLESRGGDLRIGTLLDVSGGSSSGKPGAGGTVNGTPGPEGEMASLDIAGRVTANGGEVAKGGTGDGAAGGTIKLILEASLGRITVEPTGQVQADGGGSRGAGTAGAAGIMYLFTKHGDVSMHGQLLVRGGAAPDGGGTGGRGGLVYLFTGDGHDRMSGTLIIESDGTIDASGGPGSTGGSARNDGIAGSVGVWPSRQDNELDVENIAILINSDGVHGADRGWQENRGQVIARGGASNGSGGDVAFHGKRQDGNETPLPGNMTLDADGTGTPGDFAGE
jgi:hypothetical protein